MSTGVSILLALPADVPNDLAMRAQVCSSGGTDGRGAMGSCESAGMGNGIRAEGGGLNPAPEKRKFHQISSSLAAVNKMEGWEEDRKASLQ